MITQFIARASATARVMGRGSTFLVYTLVFLALAVTVTGPTRPAGSEHGWTIDGDLVTKVMLDGKLMSFERYQTEIVPAEPASTKLDLVVDPSAVGRGYLVAFRTPAESERYLESVGAVIPAPVVRENPRGAELRAQAVARMQHTLNGERIDLVGCSSPYSINAAYLYDGIGCTGSYLSMWSQDQIPSMGTYGFNDKISSVNLGNCIYMLKMFRDSNYLGGSVTYYGPASVGASTLGNEVSSATTPGTRC